MNLFPSHIQKYIRLWTKLKILKSMDFLIFFISYVVQLAISILVLCMGVIFCFLSLAIWLGSYISIYLSFISIGAFFLLLGVVLFMNPRGFIAITVDKFLSKLTVSYLEKISRSSHR